MFGSLMRDMERDPIFGGHSRLMNNRMMNSFFGDNSGLNFGGFGGFPGAMMPFGPPMNQRSMFGMDPFGGVFPPHMGMTNDLSLHNQFGPSFSSMSVMSMQSNGAGAPIVYQASSSTRQGPGGVKETRKTVCDSRSGVKKMSVGRHLGERGHVLEREENLWTGQREENEELVNLDFEEKPDFDREWRNRVGAGVAAADPYGRRSITGPNVGRSSTGRNVTYAPNGVVIEEVDDDEDTPRQAEPMRALPPPPVSSSSPHHHPHHHARRPKDRRQPRISKNRSKKL